MVLTRGMKSRLEAQERRTAESKKIPCNWFERGNNWCCHGKECYYNHDCDESIKAEEQASCTICYDTPQHYGLLEDCSHVFCLECIQRWRKHSIYELEDENTANQRKCPVCRARSRLVLPTNYLPTAEQKKRMMERKKDQCAQRPCKYFNNFVPGKTFSSDPLLFHCPYFNDCLYSHDFNGQRYHYTPEMIQEQVDWLESQYDDLWEYLSEADTAFYSDEDEMEDEEVEEEMQDIRPLSTYFSARPEEIARLLVSGPADNAIEIDSDSVECTVVD